MAFFIDDEGNITLVQGDDGDVTFDGIVTVSNFLHAVNIEAGICVIPVGKVTLTKF